jgi:hypothetical protein
MSHHFDTKSAKENPAFNICDMYLFKGAADSTVMAMTVNADSGISGLDTLHPEGLYVFRFDLNDDSKEDVVFKFRFGEPQHVGGDEHQHAQMYRVIRAEGADIAGDAGEIIIEGRTDSVSSASGIRAFVGTAPELWAANAIGFFDFLSALYGADPGSPECAIRFGESRGVGHAFVVWPRARSPDLPMGHAIVYAPFPLRSEAAGSAREISQHGSSR